MQSKIQSCTTCRHVQKCWSTHTNSGNPISTQNVMINILVCRLQMDIDRDAAAKNLLQIFKPGMIRLLSYVREQSGQFIDHDQLMADMQSKAIEYLMHDYRIGDRGRATPYLFDPKQGFLTKWIKWVTGKQRKFYSHHELFAPRDESNDQDDHLDNVADKYDGGWDSIYSRSAHMRDRAEKDARDELMNVALPIIEDGVTLNSNEYRVIKFCMANGNESNASRHIDGLHIVLARMMNVSRPRITRLYKCAREKLIRRYAEVKERMDE